MPLRWLYLLTSALALLYLVAYCCWRLLLLTPLYDLDWRLPLSEVLGSWTYLPLLPLLSVAVLARSRLALFLLAVPLLFFAGEYGRQFLPRGLWLNHERPGATVVRVVTWNTHLSSDRNGEFRSFLAQQQPDLIALQEISYGLARILTDEFKEVYPYQQLYGVGSVGGLAVLSRYPLRTFEAGTDVLGCRCLKVTLDIYGQEVTVLNAHIWSPRISVDRRRLVPRIVHFDNSRQPPSFRALLLQNEATSGPLIVLGDLNTTERQPNYRHLNQVLHNAHATAGWGMGYTFPTNVRLRTIPLPPFVRIDHIFYNDAWQAVAARSGRLVESDHGYVMADLVLLHPDLNPDFGD